MSNSLYERLGGALALACWQPGRAMQPARSLGVGGRLYERLRAAWEVSLVCSWRPHLEIHKQRLFELVDGKWLR
jgi:hypothetical protein